MSDLYEEGRNFFDLEDYEKALEIYFKGDSAGDIYCSFDLGQLLINGWGTEKDEKKANVIFAHIFPMLKKFAEEGVALAQEKLCIAYHNGYYVEKNNEESFYWCQKAAEQGNVKAQKNLGVLYYNGEGVEKSYEQAAYWYTKAAEQGLKFAQDALGDCYYNGEGVEKSYEQAVYWYTKAAEQGLEFAQDALGDRYYTGEGVEKSYEQAVYWYAKAADQGYVKAQFSLACMYYNGEGVEKSYEQAVYWYTKAAEQGDVNAQMNLGVLYYTGEGVEKSYEQAVYWYTKSAKKGNVKSQHNLALLYAEGEGVEQNYKQAVYWWTRAAKMGNDRAQCKLGVWYSIGKGVEQNYKRAVYWLKKSAKQGNDIAQYHLGVLYYLGEGIERDYKKVVSWWRKAAKEGNTEAKCNLGAMYYEGEGVEQSYKKAVMYFQQAISGEEKSAEAFYYLGDCYHNGYHVKQDLKKAKEYYQTATENGYNCKYALEMVEKDLLLEDFYQKALEGLPIDEKGRAGKAREIAKKKYEEYLSQDGIRALMRDLAKKGYLNPERKDAIVNDLKNDFGETWDLLKENAKKSLVTAFFIYSVFLDMGKDYYENLDFSPVINQLSKAYEIELREFFFKGYLKFLKHKNIACNEFVKKNAKQQISIIKTIVDEKTKEERYEYQKENGTAFTLGSFYYLIDSKELEKVKMLDIVGVDRTSAEVNNSTKVSSRIIMGDKFSERTVNKHILEYALELFDNEAFSTVNREKEIVNYLIDISTDTNTIKNYRNRGAHEKTMDKDEAALTADYLVKIHKRLKNFIEKIKSKYLTEKGYYPEEI